VNSSSLAMPTLRIFTSASVYSASWFWIMVTTRRLLAASNARLVSDRLRSLLMSLGGGG
jgi:hypothetical protein